MTGDDDGWSLPEGQTTTFEADLGITCEPTGEADGAWRASFEVGDHHRQVMGIVHGGMYAALAETVASVGTLAAVVDDGFVAMGQSNATNFLRPSAGGRVDALAVPLHRGRTTWVWDVEMTNGGKRVARSTVTIAVRPRPDLPA